MFSCCSNSFACSQPRMFLMMLRLIWTERSSWEVVFFLRDALCLNQTEFVKQRHSLYMHQLVQLQEGFDPDRTSRPWFSTVLILFSGFSVFESFSGFTRHETYSSCNCWLPNGSQKAGIEKVSYWRVDNGKVWKKRELLNEDAIAKNSLLISRNCYKTS